MKNLLNRYLFLTALAAVLLLSACDRNFEDIEVKDVSVERVGLSSAKSVDAVLLVDIENPTSFDLHLENLKGSVFKKNKRVATFYSDDHLELASKKVSRNRLKVRITLENQELVGLMLNLKGIKPDEYSLDVGADIRYKLIKVPYEKKAIPVKDIIAKIPKKVKNKKSAITKSLKTT